MNEKNACFMSSLKYTSPFTDHSVPLSHSKRCNGEKQYDEIETGSRTMKGNKNSRVFQTNGKIRKANGEITKYIFKLSFSFVFFNFIKKMLGVSNNINF